MVPVIGTIAGVVIGAVAAISYWAGKDKRLRASLPDLQPLAADVEELKAQFAAVASHGEPASARQVRVGPPTKPDARWRFRVGDEAASSVTRRVPVRVLQSGGARIRR